MSSFAGSDHQSPEDVLKSLAHAYGCDVTSPEFATEMDERDPLRSFRNEFTFPTSLSVNGETVQDVHLCGHSLGLKPKRCDVYVQKALTNWSEKGINTHFEGYLPALRCETLVQDEMASLVGAKPSEVAILNGLTVNLHLMLTAFYRPTDKRFKIMIEDNAFGSDMYAVKSQIARNGYSPEKALITFKPRQGEFCLRHQDVLDVIAAEGHETSVILLPGIQYLTGQRLDLPTLIKAGKKQGCVVGLDLAHAVGNIPLRLHDWGADFGVWCTYKYLNAGPGSLGALWVHEHHCNSSDIITGNKLKYLQGWFGTKIGTRLNMDSEFDPDEGAARFKLSNTSPIMVAMLKASLEIFLEAGLERLWKKQFLLTGYLEYLLNEELKEFENKMRIITPKIAAFRGSQLSILFDKSVNNLVEVLRENRIHVDVRKQQTVRVAPVPLYNSFSDVFTFVSVLKKCLKDG